MHRIFSLFVGAVVMLVSAKASASFHVTKIVQVFAGSAANPNASYVQLQAYSPGQNSLGGHTLTIFNAAGTQIGSVALAAVANGTDQANVLIGTPSVTAAFGVAPDFTLPANLVQAGGKVCFDAIPVTCFAWGNYAGLTTDTGNSFAALTAGMAAKRTITGGSSATLLDSGDDTKDSAADFTAVAPAPRNNSFGVVVPDGGTTTDSGVDSSAPPADSGTPDSGVGTIPTPPREGGTSSGDPAGTSTSSSSSGDSGGCSLSAQSSEGWSTTLGLLAAVTILVLSRRRRA